MTDLSTAPRSGFRPLRVTARKPETAQVTSFWLEPEEAEGWRDFQAGQFLSFRLPSNDARGKMLRNYSLASAPHEQGRYQICVKRERPESGANAGQGSGYFHEQVQVGSVLYADGPRGNFVLKPIERPVVMISAGIGMTPLVAMAKAAVRQTRHPVRFIHECDNAASHIMRADMVALADAHPQLMLHPLYLDTSPPLDGGSLRPHLPADADTYLCGPTPFMQRAYAALRQSGVPSQHIAAEFFGPLIDLERDWQTR